MKSTKKSLLMSALSIILCIAMLLGTTYAWFTDSVTSGKNTIVAGNLDVELTHTNASVADEPVQDKTNLFGVSLWEPGVVAYENFTVSNVGNLALKYALNLNVFDKNTYNGKDLTEVIKVAVVDDGFSGDRAVAQALTFGTLADFQETGNLAAGDTTGDTFGVVLYWEPTDHDNEYNVNNGGTTSDGQPLFVEFGVNLVATQDTVESDSFDDQYDLSANLPAVVSFPSIKKEDLTTDKSVKIEEKGAVKSAEVPAKGTATVFNELKKDEVTYDNDLTLTLNVNETGSKEKEVEGGKEKTLDLDINMSAVMTSTNVSTKEVTTTKQEKVESLTEFVTIEMNIGADYAEVSVKHNGNEMQKLANVAAVPTDTVNGGYFYNDADGILTLKTMTFSPFSVTAFKSNLPKKGTLVKMDLVPSSTTVYPVDACPIGDDGKETYRILKVNGTQALVLAMYDAEKEIDYNDEQKIAFDSGSSYLKYDDSNVDKSLNNFYGKLTDDAKTAIVATTIKQGAYSKNENQTAPLKYDYTYSKNEITDKNSTQRVTERTIGERNIFALDISEIYDYLGSDECKINDLINMFYNEEFNPSRTKDANFVWLRSACTTQTSYEWGVLYGTYFSGLNANGYNYTLFGNSICARPAFVIDLSKVEWAKVN